VIVSAQMPQHNGLVMRAMKIPEVQAYFTALVARVMLSASSPQRGKGPTTNSGGRLNLWLRSNG
jgi:hypothetical protein